MARKTIVEYAEHIGCSRQAIWKAKKAGYVKVGKDGSIDTSDPVNLAYEQTATENRKKGRGKRKKHTRIEPTPADEIMVEPVDEMPAEGEPMKLYGLDQFQANQLETIEKIRKLQVTTAEKRHELIDKKLVIKLIKKLYAIDTNELTVLCNRVAPNIAAIFESEDPGHILQVEELLLDEMYNSLESIKNALNNWLVEQKEQYEIN